jgi:hypothetical protein
MPQRTLCPKCHGQRTTSCVACRGTGKNSIAGITIGLSVTAELAAAAATFVVAGAKSNRRVQISTGKDSPCFTTTSKMMSKTWSVEEHDTATL